MSFWALVSGAIAGGLIEYILGQLLPEKPRYKHLFAVGVAILVFGLISIRDTGQLKSAEKLISAKKDWQNTEIKVNKGDIITFEHRSGEWTVGGNRGATPNIGAGGYNVTYDNIVKDAKYGGLLGRIGENTPFFIGRELEYVSPYVNGPKF